MNPKGILSVLLILSLFLFGCAKTEVVTLDQPVQNQTTAAQAETPQTPEEPKIPAATTNTTGKTAVKCEDTDALEFTSSGRATVTYDDGSKQDYIDDCPGKSNILVEYYCEGVNVKTKLHICEEICVAGICIE